jgi:NitT/TauT family transport system substrate-binding protein
MTKTRFSRGLTMTLALAILPVVAYAKDSVRVVDSQALVYDAYSLYLAKEDGMFEAENLDVSIILGRGGSDSLQAVVTGSQDMIYGTGTLAAISAAAKGAPVTIIANAAYGAGEIFWYVRSDSPIRSFKDLDGGKDMAFSTPGSVTHLVTQTIAKELDIKPKFVSVGAAAAARTQMMSGQVQTAWAPFPVGLDLLRAGEIRQIGTGAESRVLSATSVRVTAANSNWLAKNRPVVERFMRALWKAEEKLFANPNAVAERIAKHWNVPVEDVRESPKYYNLGRHTFTPIGNVEGLLKMAQDYGFLKEAVAPDQLRKMIDVVYAGPK